MKLSNEQCQLIARALRTGGNTLADLAVDGITESQFTGLLALADEFDRCTAELEPRADIAPKFGPVFPEGTIREAVRFFGDDWSQDYALNLNAQAYETQLEREIQAGDVVRDAFLPGLGVGYRHAIAACIGLPMVDHVVISNQAMHNDARRAPAC